MARRDRSQGFGFHYVNIGELLKKGRIAGQEEDIAYATHGPQVVRFQGALPARIPAHVKAQVQQAVISTPSPATQAQTTSQRFQERKQAIGQVKRNLDRLQTLHHRLHTILADLNKSSGTKKGNDEKE